MDTSQSSKEKIETLLMEAETHFRNGHYSHALFPALQARDANRKSKDFLEDEIKQRIYPIVKAKVIKDAKNWSYRGNINQIKELIESCTSNGFEIPKEVEHIIEIGYLRGLRENIGIALDKLHTNGFTESFEEHRQRAIDYAKQIGIDPKTSILDIDLLVEIYSLRDDEETVSPEKMLISRFQEVDGYEHRRDKLIYDLEHTGLGRSCDLNDIAFSPAAKRMASWAHLNVAYNSAENAYELMGKIRYGLNPNPRVFGTPDELLKRAKRNYEKATKLAKEQGDEYFSSFSKSASIVLREIIELEKDIRQ